MVLGLRGETEETHPGQGGGSCVRFLRRCNTTALVVPNKPLELKGIVLAYDGSEGARCALRATRNLAGYLGGVPIKVAWVRDGSETDGNPLEEASVELERSGLQAEQHILEGEPAEVLPAFMAEVEHDLLILGYRSRLQMGGGTLGRVTERLILGGRVGMILAQ